MKQTILIFILLCANLVLSQGQIDSLQKKIILVDSLYFETDDIVVTGTRTNKKIIDVPYSVKRLALNDFVHERKLSVSDVINDVPGVFMQSRYGNHDVRISIRGYGSRSNSGIRGVRILLDGIPESEPDGQTRIEAIDFNSLGSVEIVKGNSSSLYTNAPGGVINFINNINFINSFFIQHNEIGSFGLKRNGFSAGVRTNNYGLLVSYTYHNNSGFRPHSSDYWHILNTVFEVIPGDGTNLQLLGYFVDGVIRIPGSLTKTEFETDPLQAGKNETQFDILRLSKKGRFGVRFTTSFGTNEIEATAYTAIKYFHRTARNSYRIMNRNVLGGSFKFVNRSMLFDKANEFSFGGDLFNQFGPIEDYNNINGKKGDILNFLTDETISSNGIYFQNMIDIIAKKFSVLVSGRYEKISFDQKNQMLETQNHIRSFEAFTPKIALNYKLLANVALYASVGKSFDTPAGNELENFPFSSDPGKLMNPDLKPQNASNFEVGIKGNYADENYFFKKIFYEATFFHINIKDEIVPFEVNTNVYYRNSANTFRNGVELGSDISVLPNLNFKASYTFSNFYYKDYLAIHVSQDPNTGNIIETAETFSNNVVPSVPKHYATSSLNYLFDIDESLSSFAKVAYNFASGMYVDDGNTDKTGDYSIFNFSFGLDRSFGRFKLVLSLGMNNVFDKSYVGFININSSSKRFYELGEPRSFFSGLSFRYDF